MTRKRPGLPARSLSAERFLELSHIAVAPSEIVTAISTTHCGPPACSGVLRFRCQFTVYPLSVKIPEVEVTVHWHESFDK